MTTHDEQYNPWTIIDATTVYDNKWLSLIHHNVLNPAGGKGVYGKVHFKIPEGGCPLGDDSLEAAKRELLEETGLKAANWIKLGDAYLSNSVCDEYAEYFLATALSQHAAEPEETEQLMVKKLPLKEVFAMAYDGRIKDALSLLPLQKLELMLLKGEIVLSVSSEQ